MRDKFGVPSIDDGVGIALIVGDQGIQSGGLHQVEGDEGFAMGGKLLKQINAASQGDAGKIDFEELGVAAAVGGGVEDGVDIVKDGFGAGEVTELGGEGFEELGGKVGAAFLGYFSAILQGSGFANGVEVKGCKLHCPFVAIKSTIIYC
jgi:hypothetical protein